MDFFIHPILPPIFELAFIFLIQVIFLSKLPTPRLLGVRDKEVDLHVLIVQRQSRRGFHPGLSFQEVHKPEQFRKSRKSLVLLHEPFFVLLHFSPCGFGREVANGLDRLFSGLFPVLFFRRKWRLNRQELFDEARIGSHCLVHTFGGFPLDHPHTLPDLGQMGRKVQDTKDDLPYSGRMIFITQGIVAFLIVMKYH